QIASGGTSSIDTVEVLAVWNGTLFAGTTEGNGAEVYRYNGGTSWTKVTQASSGQIASGGSTNIDSAYSMAIYDNSLYLGTGGSGGDRAQLYRYDGGTTWTLLNATAGQFTSDTSSINYVKSLATYNGALYLGTQKNNDS